MDIIKETAEKIREADALLIGASNGLSITEGLHLFADNQAFEDLFRDLKRKYGLTCILHGMGAKWPSEEEKWGFWSRLVRRYCKEYQETQVMTDLKAVIGEKDCFVITSNGECHFEMCGFSPEKIYEVEGNWLTMQCASGVMTVFIRGEISRRKWLRWNGKEKSRRILFHVVLSAEVRCRFIWRWTGILSPIRKAGNIWTVS